MMTALQLVRPTKPAQGTTQVPPLDEPANESIHAPPVPEENKRMLYAVISLNVSIASRLKKTRNVPTFPDMRFRRSGRQAQAGHVRRSYTLGTRPSLLQQLCLFYNSFVYYLKDLDIGAFTPLSQLCSRNLASELLSQLSLRGAAITRRLVYSPIYWAHFLKNSSESSRFAVMVSPPAHTPESE